MIIDSHCHLDFSAFDNDRDAVLSRASSAGIHKIIIPGVIHRTWPVIKQLCEQYPQLYACYGLHPYFLDQHQTQHLDDLKIWLEKNKPIAVGECGLDFFLKDLDKNTQQFYFEQQLDLAVEFNLPVVIHARKSTEAVINALKSRATCRGMIHSYSGSLEQAKKLIDMGFYLSFGGPITYEKSTRLRQLVKDLPLDSILAETDAPDQPVASAKNKRNEPAYITDVLKNIATLHSTDIENISQITANNAKRCFNL